MRIIRMCQLSTMFRKSLNSLKLLIMIKISAILLIAISLALAGCSITLDELIAGKRKINPNKEDLRAPLETSILVAYNIPNGIQRDDSSFINYDNLNDVARMAACPAVSIRENPFSYQAQAKIDRDDMTVKVNINRANCSIDNVAVQKYLDSAIVKNKKKRFEQIDREQRERELNPRGPYKLGCEAYQQSIRGGRDITSIETATKLYPKINAVYVRNLFVTGWNDAKLYGVRGVDCDYLSLSVNSR